jgi:hypothetical protein
MVLANILNVLLWKPNKKWSFDMGDGRGAKSFLPYRCSFTSFLVQRVGSNFRVVHVGFVANKVTQVECFLWAFQFSRQLSSHLCSVWCDSANIHMYGRIPLIPSQQEQSDDSLSKYYTIHIKSGMPKGVKIPLKIYNINFIMTWI